MDLKNFKSEIFRQNLVPGWKDVSHTINKFDRERINLFGVEATRQHVAKEQIRWSIKDDSQTSSLDS